MSQIQKRLRSADSVVVVLMFIAQTFPRTTVGGEKHASVHEGLNPSELPISLNRCELFVHWAGDGGEPQTFAIASNVNNPRAGKCQSYGKKWG